MSTCSVIICAYADERWDDLIAAVASVQDQTVAPGEIIVVVDHNSSLLARVHAHLSGVVAVENREDRGLGGARNSGVAVARGDIIAFLDDDAIAAPDWLAHFQAAYADPAVLGVGGWATPLWLGGKPIWFPEEFSWVVGCSYRGQPEIAAPVRNFHGCNMSFRREILAELGGFQLGYGCDETELCIRAGRRWPHGILLHQPRARILHRVPASRSRWRYFRSRCFFEGRSKAVVAWLVGPGDGLASERSYTFRTLPSGVVRGLMALLRRDYSGALRAAAIIAGLAFTTAGYLSGKLTVAEAARERGWRGNVAGSDPDPEISSALTSERG